MTETVSRNNLAGILSAPGALRPSETGGQLELRFPGVSLPTTVRHNHYQVGYQIVSSCL